MNRKINLKCFLWCQTHFFSPEDRNTVNTLMHEWLRVRKLSSFNSYTHSVCVCVCVAIRLLCSTNHSNTSSIRKTKGHGAVALFRRGCVFGLVEISAGSGCQNHHLSSSSWRFGKEALNIPPTKLLVMELLR